MTAPMSMLLRELNRRAESGKPASFWLRDDDATQPTPLLERLIDLTGGYSIPLTLAVIPAASDEELAKRLATEPHISVAVHGWSHQNHAPASEKSQELGSHRPVDAVLDEMARGYAHLEALHGPHFLPMLVPPWNRIDEAVIAGLPALHYQALSVFGPERNTAVKMLNTHVDIIDWRGNRGGRPEETLVKEILAALEVRSAEPVGLLTHHLVHDESAWTFLTRLLAATSRHDGCLWHSSRTLIA